MTTESDTENTFTDSSIFLPGKIEETTQKVKDSGSVLIGLEEIANTKIPPAYLVKSKIKSAFGPVSGCTKLEFMPGYQITETQEPGEAYYKYSWERV